jgi:hypothetical protein
VAGGEPGGKATGELGRILDGIQHVEPASREPVAA